MIKLWKNGKVGKFLGSYDDNFLFKKYSEPYFYESESPYTHATCSSRSYSRHKRNDLKIKDSWLHATYLPIQGEMQSSSKLIKQTQDGKIVIPFNERTKTI